MRPSPPRRTRAQAFRDAARGIYLLFASQCHARIHGLAALVVIVLGWSLQISATEWLWLVLAIALVLVAEALNTAIELLGDAVTKDYHPLIGRAKDIAAGAVLLASSAAAIIGALVLVPHLRALGPAAPHP
ncbi:MAG: diacylglycerol kinase family protein [Chthoniobacteraceae bacterium]